VDVQNENLGLAFGLTAMAGLSTCIGAVLPFFPCIRTADNRVLVISLGLSAGVMVYISFVEILALKARSAMKCVNADLFELWTVLLFFAGIVIMHGFHVGLHHLQLIKWPKLLKRNLHCQSVNDVIYSTQATDVAMVDTKNETAKNETEESQNALDMEFGVACDDNTIDTDQNADVETMTEGIEGFDKVAAKKLQDMGILTAMSVFIHNLPEGLATFFATLADPRLGVAVAIAIAVHNIPEGLAVAMPIYYASNLRARAFGIAVLSGTSEPFGAFLGWIALRNSMTNAVYGVIFALVGGMMIYIVVKELIPTGYRYDPHDKYMTYSIIVGMLIMALSLVLFSL